MPMFFRLLSVFCGLCLAFAAHAQGTPVEGVDYIELRPPQSVESSDRVEVLEFFWYRCPHCYALEPELEAWASTAQSSFRIPGERLNCTTTGRSMPGFSTRSRRSGSWIGCIDLC